MSILQKYYNIKFQSASQYKNDLKELLNCDSEDARGFF